MTNLTRRHGPGVFLATVLFATTSCPGKPARDTQKARPGSGNVSSSAPENTWALVGQWSAALKKASEKAPVDLNGLLSKHVANLPTACRARAASAIVLASPKRPGLSPGLLVLTQPPGHNKCKSPKPLPPACAVTRSSGGGKTGWNAASVKLDAINKTGVEGDWITKGECTFLKIIHEGEEQCKRDDSKNVEIKHMQLVTYHRGVFTPQYTFTLEHTEEGGEGSNTTKGEMTWHKVAGKQILAFTEDSRSSQEDPSEKGKTYTKTKSTVDLYEVTKDCRLRYLKTPEDQKLRRQPGGDKLPTAEDENTND